MTRKEFIEELQEPLMKTLETKRIFRLALQPAGSNSVVAANPGRRVVASTIRYAALCYGVPIRILPDPGFVEPVTEQLRPELRRNEASVDSQLTCLPASELNLPWVGAIPNPFFGATNGAMLNPTNGILMVSRLDGPTPAIARGLVDKAMQAERDGLWGRAYFDLRNISDPGYKVGDDWIRGASENARRAGFETVVDEKPELFPAGFPMSQIAIYIGWYSGDVEGPLA